MSPPSGWRYARDDSQGFGIFFDESTADKLGERDADLDKHRRAARAGARAEGRSARDAVEAIAPNAPASIDRIAAELRLPTADEIASLAAALFLPPGVFAALGVRFRAALHGSGGNRAAFVFPERDGTGRVTGLNLRHVDGSKLTYGPRGLFIPSTIDPDDLGDHSRPLVCCEGVSDAAALLAMHVTGIGRPSNTVGGELLGEWCKCNGLAAGGVHSLKPIIVLGENDAKIGGDWPGRDGAERTARILAEAIGRPVLVAYPPPPVKDVRDHLRRHLELVKSDDGRSSFHVVDNLTLRDVGELLVENLTITAYEVDGIGPIDAGIRPTDPTGGDIIATKTAELAAAGVTLQPNELPSLGPSGSSCESPHRVLMRHCTKPQLGLFYFPCRTSSCRGCLPRKREHCRGTVQHHLRAWGRPVYRSFVTRDRWINTARTLQYRRKHEGRRDKPADWFRVDDGNGPHLVISTIPADEDSVILDAEDAAARLSVVLGAVPFTSPKTFTTSRAWSLLADPERAEQKWLRVSAAGSDQQQAAAILDAHGANWRPWISKGRWWETPGITISENGVDIDRVSLDLQAGELIPAGNAWLGFNESEAA